MALANEANRRSLGTSPEPDRRSKWPIEVTVSSLRALEGWFVPVKKGHAMGKTGTSADGKVPAQTEQETGLRRGRIAAAPSESDGPLGPKQKQLVQRSFAKVEPIAETAAELFYKKLFEFDPSVKAPFKTDITEPGRKLMATLTAP